VQARHCATHARRPCRVRRQIVAVVEFYAGCRKHGASVARAMTSQWQRLLLHGKCGPGVRAAAHITIDILPGAPSETHICCDMLCWRDRHTDALMAKFPGASVGACATPGCGLWAGVGAGGARVVHAKGPDVCQSNPTTPIPPPLLPVPSVMQIVLLASPPCTAYSCANTGPSPAALAKSDKLVQAVADIWVRIPQERQLVIVLENPSDRLFGTVQTEPVEEDVGEHGREVGQGARAGRAGALDARTHARGWPNQASRARHSPAHKHTYRPYCLPSHTFFFFFVITNRLASARL
jgi:hypothetical protein